MMIRLLSEPVSGRQNYIDACRSVRNVFKEARERAFKICAFARELKAHTHCAYSFKLCVGMKIVVDRLNSLGYVQVSLSGIVLSALGELSRSGPPVWVGHLYPTEMGKYQK